MADEQAGHVTCRWGVIGAGRIARDFVAGIGASRSGILAAVASSDRARALALAAGAENAAAYGDYAALLADPGVDAVYIATLHPQHAGLIAACAEAGKHVLCEKPLTLTGAEAAAAMEAAAAAGIVLVEAMMYRFQPQTECVRAALADGLIGTPLHVDVSCAFTTVLNPGDRLFNPAAGGGAILDVGCYAMSFARMVAGWTLQDDAVEPAELTGGGHLCETGVEDWAVARLVFPGGLTANVRTGIRLADTSQAHIYGSEGHLHIADPWTPGKGGREPRVMLSRAGDNEGRLLPCASAPLFGAEIDAVWDARDHGEARVMSPRDSVATMRSLDRWRRAAGAG
ncbi:MAG TPA: Gfo/Idh/MocA family oxidoreductase [Streptosporangiaceae bacterium]|nr:Gfo/Idh/MocA family oxidoreductase [Streptosporangiaceae bacterium]